MIILTSCVLHILLKAPPYQTVDGTGRVKVGEGQHVRQRRSRCGHTLKMGSCPPKPLPFFWRLQAVLKVGGDDDKVRKTGSKNNMLSNSF